MDNKFTQIFSFFLIFFIIGCERPSIIDETQFPKEEDSYMPPSVEKKLEVKDPSLSPLELEPKDEKSVLLPKEEKPAPLSLPIIPSFSDELLKAVDHWQRIPKSVFPLKSVQIFEDVPLEAKTQTGSIIARSIAPSGDKITVLGIDDGRLVVANPNSTKLRGTIEIDQTDFKQMVAYLFEYRNQQRQNYAKQSASKKTDEEKSSQNQKLETQSINDDIISDPLDFGHGRFCICQECREKRLAQTGSLKTGHGIEP